MSFLFLTIIKEYETKYLGIFHYEENVEGYKRVSVIKMDTQ